MEDIKNQASHYSMHNIQDLKKGKICGCFYCLKIFNFIEIEDWSDNEDTALCPYCEIDSVIGEGSGFIINEPLLKEIHQMYF